MASHIVATHHQHFFNFRLDFDVDGDQNSVYEMHLEPEILPPDHLSQNAFVLNQRLLRSEKEAQRDVDFRSHRIPQPSRAEFEFSPNLNAGASVLARMNTNQLTKNFERLGARAKVRPLIPSRWRPNSGPVVIDIGSDRRGEFFDIQATQDADVQVLDVQPRDRHLLLMVRQSAERPGLPDTKDKFLCGHDERHWFVAGVPESAPVSSVITAKEALKPELVRNLESGKRGKRAKRQRRKTETFVRQGEWFFIPAPGVTADEKLVLRNEPLRRGRGKPHNCECLYRVGGTTVYVCRRYPNGLTETERKQEIQRNAAAAKWNWQVMRRDPSVFVRGRVSHADHATVHLEGWHRVAMNTETQSRAMASVAFLD